MNSFCCLGAVVFVFNGFVAFICSIFARVIRIGSIITHVVWIVKVVDAPRL